MVFGKKEQTINVDIINIGPSFNINRNGCIDNYPEIIALEDIININ